MSSDAGPVWRNERFWLFSIAAIALAVVAVIVFILGFTDKQVNEMLFGSLITGLLMIIQKVIEAGQMRQAVQKLGESQPLTSPGGVPAGTADDPMHVAGAEPGELPVRTTPEEGTGR